MRYSSIHLLGITLGMSVAVMAQTSPDTATFQKFKPRRAPQTSTLMLKQGDRLAICGDSITEQKMYSRLIEDYLTMCMPQLQVSVRQYGWSGERAPGFLARMTNDCLRFKPTIATTCYGMNDHEYRPYEESIGQTYRENSTAIVDAFKANGARVIQGSPGCVGKLPGWVKSASGSVDDLNMNLCTLRNIGIEIAQKEQVSFADVFWPMLTAGMAGQKTFGTNFAIAGTDGVHPGWAGQTVMAYAFLKALGLDGNLATFTADLKHNTLQASPGHEASAKANGEFEIKSSRYAFCACAPETMTGAAYPRCSEEESAKDTSIRAALSLVPFQKELNRFMFIAVNGGAQRYKLSWGNQSKTFAADALARGINLAEEFPNNPFSENFVKVDAAVLAKQSYETKQIKQFFRSPEAKVNLDEVATKTEAEREPLVEAIKAAFVPVTHVIRVVPEL